MSTHQETLDTWNKVARLYQDRFMHVDLYNDTYDSFCEQLQLPNPSVLEIGCGPGNITRYLLNKRPDFIIHGIDLSPNMIELAKANNPTAHFTVMDCRNINCLQQKYDGIIGGFCIPYLSATECSALLKDCSGLLTGKGLLYISFEEGDYLNSGFRTGSTGDRVYFYYHSPEFITNELKGLGFKITAVFRKQYQGSSGGEETHVIIIARK